MSRLDQFRRPGYVPRQLASMPKGLRRTIDERRLSLLQLREMAGNDDLRGVVRRSARISESELKRALGTLENLIPKADPSPAVAPIHVPPSGGILAPHRREMASESPPIPRFWNRQTHVLPRAYDLLDLFRYKALIPQRMPDCVGHACRNAAEVQLNVCDRHLSGLFAWEYAMEKAGYPIPPRGTWPAVVLEGIAKRGVCWEALYAEDNYHEDRDVRPTAEALADAARHKIETFVNLRSVIGEAETIDLMCMLLYGSDSLKLKGRVLVVGVKVPREWLLPESLITGIRPMPLTDKPKAGHSFDLIGYFHHRGQRWFIGLENWGGKIGSRNPFGYPRTMGPCFIPAGFLRDPKWLWDLAIALTREEAKAFSLGHAPSLAGAVPTTNLGLWLFRVQCGLAVTAGVLGILRLLFPGNWW